MHSDEQTPPNRPSQNKWAARITVTVAIALVAVPLILLAIPSEVGRWHQAAAVESIWAENYEDAIKSLDEALSRTPESSTYLAQRAAVLIELKRFDEAIETCDQALAAADGIDASALYHRATAFQRLGAHTEALADIEQLVDLAAKKPPIPIARIDGFYFSMTYEDALNARAYARALAETEIDAALDDINTAFERMGKEDIASYLDTRGYLYYLKEDFARADEDMQRAIELIEEEWTAERFEELAEEDTGVAKMAIRLGRETLAVLYHHQALVAQALGREAEAKRDFKRAEEYGYSPEDGVW